MKNDYPSASVIIPCFNASRFVGRAIRSVASQSAYLWTYVDLGRSIAKYLEATGKMTGSIRERYYVTIHERLRDLYPYSPGAGNEDPRTDHSCRKCGRSGYDQEA